MQRLPPLLLAASLAPALSAQFLDDFEGVTASPTGTILTGQNGYYLPAVGGIDWNVYTYAGNSLGVVANPGGGANFGAGLSPGANCRAQHAVNWDNVTPWRMLYDVCCLYTGAATPTNNIGSVSLQDSGASASFIALARWPTSPTGATWNADFVRYTAANVSTTGQLPNPNFQGLTTNHWYNWATEFDFVSNRVLAIEITDLTTLVTHRYEPTDWYLNGGALGGLPLPTDFRWFASGSAGNVMAVDNALMLPLPTAPYGNGCVGTAGTPLLSPFQSSLPLLGTTFILELANMPPAGGAALLATGFSDTTFQTFALPFDLGGFGAPGCSIVASPEIITFLLNVGGSTVWPLSIPNDPGLAGTRFVHQGFVLDAGANNLGLSVSNGSRTAIR